MDLPKKYGEPDRWLIRCGRDNTVLLPGTKQYMITGRHVSCDGFTVVHDFQYCIAL